MSYVQRTITCPSIASAASTRDPQAKYMRCDRRNRVSMELESFRARERRFFFSWKIFIFGATEKMSRRLPVLTRTTTGSPFAHLLHRHARCATASSLAPSLETGPSTIQQRVRWRKDPAHHHKVLQHIGEQLGVTEVCSQSSSFLLAL